MDLVWLGAFLPASIEQDGSHICFMHPVFGMKAVRLLSAVRGHGVVERPEYMEGMEEQPLLDMNSGSREENPAPDWLLY